MLGLDRTLDPLADPDRDTHGTGPCIVEASHLLEIPRRFELLKWSQLGGAGAGLLFPHNVEIGAA